MVSPNHQPILDDAERAMDNGFQEDKEKEQSMK
jgi:hypothetical protein